MSFKGKKTQTKQTKPTTKQPPQKKPNSKTKPKHKGVSVQALLNTWGMGSGAEEDPPPHI